MAAYADFEFYESTFFGDVLTERNANKWLSMASDELDALTFGRLAEAFPEKEEHADKVRKSVCAIAEALYSIDIQRKAVAAEQAADGSVRAAVSTMSSGRESITYALNNGASSVYGAAAASVEEQNKLVRSIAVKYISNVADAKGINLLYAGEV